MSTLLGRFESGGLSAESALSALLDELQILICNCVTLAPTGVGGAFVGWAGLPHRDAEGLHVPLADSTSVPPSVAASPHSSTVSPLSADSPQGRLLGAPMLTLTPPALTQAVYEAQALRTYAARATPTFSFLHSVFHDNRTVVCEPTLSPL